MRLPLSARLPSGLVRAAPPSVLIWLPMHHQTIWIRSISTHTLHVIRDIARHRWRQWRSCPARIGLHALSRCRRRSASPPRDLSLLLWVVVPFILAPIPVMHGLTCLRPTLEHVHPLLLHRLARQLRHPHRPLRVAPQLEFQPRLLGSCLRLSHLSVQLYQARAAFLHQTSPTLSLRA